MTNPLREIIASTPIVDVHEHHIPEIFLTQDNVGGRQLGLPAQRSARFIFYNQTWARELGFPDPPTNTEEFRQQACAANASFLNDSDPKNDGYGGWIVDTNWQTTYSWFLAFDGGVVDGDAYTFRTDPCLDLRSDATTPCRLQGHPVPMSGFV